MALNADKANIMVLDTLEAIPIGGVTQWTRIRSHNPANPVLLLIQQGPGLPMINEAQTFARTLHLEEHFTVVYWDQRGCGLSSRSPKSATPLDLPLLVSDTVELLEFLHLKFGGPSLIAGFSIGATIGAMAANTRPELVTALIGVGMDINGPQAEAHAYSFALETAAQRRHKRAQRQLQRIGAGPHTTFKQFATRVRWVATFGGVRRTATYGSMVRALLGSILCSSDYTAADLVRTLIGMTTTQTALLGELAQLDLERVLPHINAPTVIVQGRHDQVAPPAVAERYFNVLEAPGKEIIWFENSAHMPHLEEPEAFTELLKRFRSHPPPASTGG